jgi:GNAT superfamily N-acetyltransferase
MIDLLSDVPHFGVSLTNHLWDIWHHDFLSFTEIKSSDDLLRYYNCSKYVYVLHENDEFISTCMIDKTDMGVKPELFPWLANVYTRPEFRNKGYAKKLIEYVLEKHQHEKLYLWTFTEKLATYYTQFGFVAKEVISQHGHLCNIIFMSKDLDFVFIACQEYIKII